MHPHVASTGDRTLYSMEGRKVCRVDRGVGVGGERA